MLWYIFNLDKQNFHSKNIQKWRWMDGTTVQLAVSQRPCCYWNINRLKHGLQCALNAAFRGEKKKNDADWRFFLLCLNAIMSKKRVLVLTSTLNGCSSPFTAHKIHSNNCKHNVLIQQLWRHLLLWAANKTIVNPADCRFLSLNAFIYNGFRQKGPGRILDV